MVSIMLSITMGTDSSWQESKAVTAHHHCHSLWQLHTPTSQAPGRECLTGIQDPSHPSACLCIHSSPAPSKRLSLDREEVKSDS